MSYCSPVVAFAALSILWCGASASADTLRCQSINGNLNCAGSGGMSCQSVDGKKVCISGHGDVVQSFGGGRSSGDNADPGDQDLDGALSDPAIPELTERHVPHGHSLPLQRQGAKQHIRSDWQSIDQD